MNKYFGMWNNLLILLLRCTDVGIGKAIKIISKIVPESLKIITTGVCRSLTLIFFQSFYNWFKGKIYSNFGWIRSCWGSRTQESWVRFQVPETILETTTLIKGKLQKSYISWEGVKNYILTKKKRLMCHLVSWYDDISV